MLSKIVQSMYGWVRSLWRRRGHSPRVRAEPSDSHLKKTKAVRLAREADSNSSGTEDVQDSSPSVPLSQTVTNDDETVECRNAVDKHQKPTVPANIEPPPSPSDRPKQTPVDPPKNVPPQEASAEDQGIVSNNNADAESPETSNNAQQRKSTGQKTPRHISSRRHRHQAPMPRLPKNDVAANLPSMPPRLICRENPTSRQWDMLLRASKERAMPIKEVRHDGESLDAVDGEYRLSSFRGTLSVVCPDREPDELQLFDDRPMCFKLLKDWRGDGRQIVNITSGYFIVIAPKEWRRKGRVPVSAQGCADTDFMAHHFCVKKNGSAEDTEGFEECRVITQSGLELTGDRVFDNSEDGELFVGAVPEMNLLPGVAWARVGEESEDGWGGENFNPSGQRLADVLNGRQGRFFVRVYNDDIKMLDSSEFRYLRDLREIHVNDEPYLEDILLAPGPAGHPPTVLRFVGVEGAEISPVPSTNGTHASAQPGGMLAIEPNPNSDVVACSLCSGAHSVDSVIKLPRIWWRIGQDADAADGWRDTPLAMTRQEYRKHVNAAAAIWLRLLKRIGSIMVGFDEELGRQYDLFKKAGETGVYEAKIPLIDFVDYSQIAQPSYESHSLNAQCADARLEIVQVTADPSPAIVSFTSEPAAIIPGERAKLEWVTRNAEPGGVMIGPGISSVNESGSMVVEPAMTKTFTLRLTVSGKGDVTKSLALAVRAWPQPGEKPFALIKRQGGGYRRGKGFSCGELHAAGLTDAEAMHRSIPIDRRRRSAHPDNIHMIERLIDA